MKRFCRKCFTNTEHIAKLDAVLEGGLICDKCRCINGKNTLIKTEDKQFYKVSDSIYWLSYNDDGTFKERHDKIALDRSLLLGPLGPSYTWNTTVVTEIIKEEVGYVKFKTENTLYELYYG